MKTKIILIVTLLFLFASLTAYSQTEATGDEKMAAGKYPDALADYTKQWATSDDSARERLVGKMAAVLAKLDKAPPIPDDAEFHYAKGVAFIKLAKTPAEAANYTKAATEFGAAINIAPWVFDYWYNYAVACKSAGDFRPASIGVKRAKTLALNDKDRRDTLTLRAEIEAAQEMADSAAAKARQEKADADKAEADKAAVARAAEERRKNSIEGYWVDARSPEVMPVFRIERIGEVLSVKSVMEGTWTYSKVQITETSLNMVLGYPAAGMGGSQLTLNLHDGDLVGTGGPRGTNPIRFVRKPWPAK